MILVDTNVIVDVLQDDPRWRSWSLAQLIDARISGHVVINAVIVAELSRSYPEIGMLRAALVPLGLHIETIEEDAAFIAGKRFVEARSGRPPGTPKRPLPDFFIGAHALARQASLLTRDAAIYRRYFPDLTLITPETHPDG